MNYEEKKSAVLSVFPYSPGAWQTGVGQSSPGQSQRLVLSWQTSQQSDVGAPCHI